ncbi:MAG: T9SS type A sorting domain-containing protein [Candidatus Kapabacteria bacterium]|nr:T9SS type A sorting domain-containing protein [Candidatus Kapabacteria bacterium]
MNNYFFVITLLSITFIYSCNQTNSINPITTHPYITADTIRIGRQVWMTKNLNFNHYRNGDSIPEVRDSATWVNLTTGAWCYYNNSDSIGKIYGKLYNWYAVNDPRGLAPKGWYVPWNTAWLGLVAYYGGSGGKLKLKGTFCGGGHWYPPNSGATNESEFSALPAGRSSDHGYSSVINYLGFWWSSSEYDIISAFALTMIYKDASAIRFIQNKVNGFSVRCLKWTYPSLVSDNQITFSQTAITYISPNPADDKVTIAYFLTVSERGSLRLYNIEGELIKMINLNNQNSGMNSIELDTKDKCAGEYFLSFQNSTQVQEVCF